MDPPPNKEKRKIKRQKALQKHEKEKPAKIGTNLFI